MRAAIPLAKPAGHGSDDLPLVVVIDRTVAPQDPDQPLVLVTPAEPLPVSRGVLRREERLAVVDLIVPVTSPGWQETDADAPRVGLVDDVIHVIPVVIAGPVLHGRPRGVEVRERQVAISIRGV